MYLLLEESDKCTVSSRISQISSSSSLTRPSTLQSTSTQTPVNGKEKTKLITRPYSSGEHVVHPSLRYSLFPAIPPTINFVAEGEKGIFNSLIDSLIHYLKVIPSAHSIKSAYVITSSYTMTLKY